MTGTQVIIEALLIDGVIYPGQTISAEAEATSEFGFNLMLGEWNAQGMAVFSVARVTKVLTSGTADYTIGTGGAFNTPRPERIEAWAVVSISGAAGNGKPVDPATFAALSEDRTATGSIIKALNYDGAYPLGTIHLYPIPNAAHTLELWVWEQFTAITDFTLAIDFPPGYMKAVIYNLAVDLAPKFGRGVDPNVQRIADECKAGLGSTNAPLHATPPVQKA